MSQSSVGWGPLVGVGAAGRSSVGSVDRVAGRVSGGVGVGLAVSDRDVLVRNEWVVLVDDTAAAAVVVMTATDPVEAVGVVTVWRGGTG